MNTKIAQTNPKDMPVWFPRDLESSKNRFGLASRFNLNYLHTVSIINDHMSVKKGERHQ